MNKELTVETRAVVAAAVYVTLGASARISAVERVPHTVVPNPDPQMQAWSHEGRRQIHTGHTIR